MNEKSKEWAFLKTLTVLYVEDDPATREEVGEFLQCRAGAVVIAADGAEGLAAFQSSPVQMIVTDIQMPAMNGLTMARNIRAMDPSVPIIITTAFEQPDFLLGSIELGVDQYVLKPIRGERLEFSLLTCAHRLLAEAQLRQQQKLEAEALRNHHQMALSILFRDLAQDFHNLLNAILEPLYSESRMDPAGGVSQVLRGFSTKLDRACALGSRLLLLADPAGPMVQVPSLDGLIRNTVEQTLAGSGTAASFDFQRSPAAVKASEAALAQVFRNLAQNAREAMAAGGTLHVSTESGDAGDRKGPGSLPDRYLRIRFRDTGPGIPPENLRMVFEPYFSTKEGGFQDGHGLGLSLCEAIVRAHGGSISAHSQPRRGTTIQVHLPLIEGDPMGNDHGW